MIRGTSPRTVPVLLLALTALACGGGDATAPQLANNPNLTLPVRIHLLTSSFDPLNSTVTESEVNTLITEVNNVWSQAGIAWTIETVIREPAQNETTFETILTGTTLPTINDLTSVLPLQNLFAQKWNIYFIKDFGGLAGGIYLPNVGSVIFPELDPTGKRDLTGSAIRILSHELGHSLSLRHVPCPTEGNLMAAGCVAPNRTLLTPTQIDQAKIQAETGSPTGS